MDSPSISSGLGICLQCIRKRPTEALKITGGIHADSRDRFGLPPAPPNDPEGLRCGTCANDCRIGPGRKGFCGLVSNVDGKLVRYGGTAEKGVLQWYYDPLPTNCVAWWFCPGCTGAGYPKFAYRPGPETGYMNLAVFYGACSYDCLFCQNWYYRNLSASLRPVMSAESLAGKVDEHVSCICYFGGDPSVQLPHALKASEIALEKAREKRRILRVCWETNGYMTPASAEKAAKISLDSGGVVKFDLKAWSEDLNKALCGVSNKPALENFRRIGQKFFRQRTDLPVLTASTLLIPGYIDVEEVEKIAYFIADIDRWIPYTLLVFYPQYEMNDLSATARALAEDCYKIAKESGLEKVRLGNIGLIGD